MSASSGDREERIEAGRRALMGSSLVEPHIDALINASVEEMVRALRGRALSPEGMYAAIGGISLLMHLKERLRSEQRLGDQAAEQEFN